MAEKAILYGYRFSSCSWRVRAALLAKRIPFEERAVDIVRGREQLTAQYRAINPAQKVPALVIDGVTLVESIAIVQYLEDTRPLPALTPKSPLDKARMTEICQTIVSGIQPLQNIGLKNFLTSDEEYTRFSLHWCERGLETLEELLGRTAGTHCVGDQLTVADLCLVPQLFNLTHRFKMDISKHPTVTRLNTQLLAQDLFQRSHPNTLKKEKDAQT
uniref:maleylacetoacetate isomerase n=1 Tax=Cnaphalocrocis medinalis TaxID=437488 RepID=A0A077DB49_CNAME|nr:glutathione S-transferase zeta 2 [Cnaphalocrocis medinalis]